MQRLFVALMCLAFVTTGAVAITQIPRPALAVAKKTAGKKTPSPKATKKPAPKPTAKPAPKPSAKV